MRGALECDCVGVKKRQQGFRHEGQVALFDTDIDRAARRGNHFIGVMIGGSSRWSANHFDINFTDSNNTSKYSDSHFLAAAMVPASSAGKRTLLMP